LIRAITAKIRPRKARKSPATLTMGTKEVRAPKRAGMKPAAAWAFHVFTWL